MAFFDELKKGISDISETVVKKSGEVLEVQKLKIKKSVLESDLKKDYAQLGQIYFTELEASGVIDDKVEDIFKRIVEDKESIEEVRVKLEKASKARICSVCGEKSDKDLAYCPHCGNKFEPLDDDAEETEDSSKAADGTTAEETTSDETTKETAKEDAPEAETAEESATTDSNENN